MVQPSLIKGTARYSKVQCWKDPSCAIFLERRRFENIKYWEVYLGHQLGHHLGHVWSIIWGLSGACSAHHLGIVDLFDGHFFGAMEWLMFFSRAPSALMVFQWFCQRWTITIKCFLTSRPSTSMVFRWFSDFLGRWLTMVLKFQGYKKCVNSTRDKMCFRNAGERITALNSFRRAAKKVVC